jgi:dCTP deaminase
MILSDSEIKKRISSGHLNITNFKEENLNPCSYDLTLNPEIAFYRDKVFDCKKEHLLAEPVVITDEGYELQPGILYLGHCNEYLKIPYNIKSTLSGKSSLGRLGLMIHLTAGFIDPGFQGSLVLELACVQPIKIYPNMLIGQIEFADVYSNSLETYSQKTKSKYNKQKGNQPSKYHLNFYGH